jgi:uncharacterized GH25 family protein
MRRMLTTLFLLALAPASALAHDYWLAPERFELPVGAALQVDLRLGGHFEAEESRPYQQKRTKSFVLVTPDGTLDLKQHAKADAMPVLAGLVPEFEGPGLIGMERHWIDIELADAKFTDYLAHEGLDAITKLRDQEGHREVERECYTRGLKSLVRVGGGEDAEGLHRRVLGHRIEIVLLDDPYRLDPGDTLRAQVLWKGKPLPDALVTAHHRPALDKGKVGTLTARTNADGEVSVRLEAGGAWLLRLVHMVPCRDCGYTDWESYWTSFSFAVD